jgi:PAS domain S-box-containing protein
MFYNNSTPVAIINQDTTFDNINDYFCHAIGYTREEVLCMKWTQLVTEDILDFLKDKNEKRVVDTKGFPDVYEITFYNQHGDKHYAQMAVTFLPKLKKRIVAFLITTKQKKALQQIQERTAMLQNEVKIKDVEITNCLLKLTNNNRLGEQICLKLKKIGTQLSDEDKDLLSEINEITCEIKFYHNSSFWETLEEHFIRSYSEFTKNLINKHPSITPSEIKLATLLSLQLKTKDIANVMIQGYDSIRVSRSRLRKKLGLMNGDNLQAYLFNFL